MIYKKLINKKVAIDGYPNCYVNDIDMQLDFNFNAITNTKLTNKLSKFDKLLMETQDVILELRNPKEIFGNLTHLLLYNEAYYSSTIEQINPSVEDATMTYKDNKIKYYFDGIIKLWNEPMNKLSVDKILNIHSCLINDTPSKIRKLDVYVGDWEPPTYYDKIIEGLNKICELYNDSDMKVHPLIKQAYIHMLFETIHPFEDGNGRTGRALVLLYLRKTYNLEFAIDISTYIDSNRDLYYKNFSLFQTKITDDISVMSNLVKEINKTNIKNEIIMVENWVDINIKTLFNLKHFVFDLQEAIQLINNSLSVTNLTIINKKKLANFLSQTIKFRVIDYIKFNKLANINIAKHHLKIAESLNIIKTTNASGMFRNELIYENIIIKKAILISYRATDYERMTSRKSLTLIKADYIKEQSRLKKQKQRAKSKAGTKL